MGRKYYHLTGFTIANDINANEFFVTFGEYYCTQWFIENGTPFSMSYEVGKLSFGNSIKEPATIDNMVQEYRTLWAISAKLGYPNWGAPSSELFKEWLA